MRRVWGIVCQAVNTACAKALGQGCTWHVGGTMRRPECLDQSEGEGERQEVVQGRNVDFREGTGPAEGFGTGVIKSADLSLFLCFGLHWVFAAVHRLLIAVASLVVEHRLSGGACMWDLSSPSRDQICCHGLSTGCKRISRHEAE